MRNNTEKMTANFLKDLILTALYKKVKSFLYGGNSYATLCWICHQKEW